MINEYPVEKNTNSYAWDISVTVKGHDLLTAQTIFDKYFDVHCELKDNMLADRSTDAIFMQISDKIKEEDISLSHNDNSARKREGGKWMPFSEKDHTLIRQLNAHP